MKKKYIKPSVVVLEFENGISILAGSLNGKVEQNGDLQYGGDTSDGDLKKDGNNNIWGD